MTPHPTPEPPQGYELLTEPFLRKHGAVEGMMFWNTTLKRWVIWVMGHDDIDDVFVTTTLFIAPLGTIAATTTPLPEVRCDCGGAQDSKQWPHGVCLPSCTSHLRYRHVLPGELAKMETKPEGLICRTSSDPTWEPDLTEWPFVMAKWTRVAYALPLQPEKGKGGEEALEPSAMPIMGEAWLSCPQCGNHNSASSTECHSCWNKLPPPAPTGDEELRVRVAEWMGAKWHWAHDRNSVFISFDGWDGDLVKEGEKLPIFQYVGHNVPAYTSSLDAIASAEANLTDPQWQRYERILLRTTFEQGEPGTSRDRCLIQATAHQRAQALLHTIEEKEQRQ